MHKDLANKTNGGFLISKIKQIQGRVFEKLLDEHGISEFNGAQGRILFVLWEKDGITVSELSQKTGLAKTTLTSMLDRLEEMGHIQRTSSPTDRRALKIVLTPEARMLEDKYNSVSDEMNDIFYGGFNDEEILAFETYLGKVLKNLLKKENNYE